MLIIGHQVKRMAATEMLLGSLTRLLEAGNEQGQFEIINPRIAAFAISGLVVWVHRWYRRGGQLSPDEIADQLAMIVQRMVEPRDRASGQADRSKTQTK